MALTSDLAPAPDLSAFLKRRPGAKPSLDLLVTGARCAACLGKIERETAALKGVDAVVVVAGQDPVRQARLPGIRAQ